jgi:hypothetical protein
VGYSITLTSGEVDSNNDFGNFQNATKSGVKFEDLDGDGVKDAGEPLLAGWEIHLFGTDGSGAAVHEVDTTDASGEYSFSVRPGNYTVCEVLQAGWTQSVPSIGADCTGHTDGGTITPGPVGYSITLTSGEVDSNNDFGNFQNATKSGVKFEDLDGDGVKDAGEPLLAGWEIHLFGTDGSGTAVHEVDTTDASGQYSFSVKPGNYTVCEILQAGWTQTSPVAGPGIVSCAGHTDGGTVTPGPLGYSITLTSGQVDDNNHFGNKRNNPGIDIEKTTNGPTNSNPIAPDFDNEDAANGPGVPILTPGSTVTWTYKVTNTGNVPFAFNDVVVVDDNGTPGNTADDLSTTNGQITFQGVSFGDADNILEPGEVWLYTASGTVQNVGPAGASTTFNFSGSSALDGPDGNVRTFSAGGISVHATGWSRNKASGTWSTAYLGSYGGGLGVTDGPDGSGSGNAHTVDNLGGTDNYVLLEFSQLVIVDSAFLGYVVSDSDLRVWIGTASDPFNNPQTLSDAFLTGLGFTELNETTLTTTRTADLNAGNIAGNVVVIAALPEDTTPEDQFKIEKMTVQRPGCYENKAVVTAPGTTPDSDLSHYCNPDNPGIDIEKTTNGPTNSNPTAPDYDNEDAQNGPGVPILTPGSTVTWTYKVTNTGDTSFAFNQVVIVDDNGTPGNTADDMSTTNGAITFDSVLVGDADNVLEPGEMWLYKATGTVQTLSSGSGSPATFDFSGNSALDGLDGNVRTFTAGTVSVNASAFSRDKSSGAWSAAYLGAYSGGLGVTDSSEGSGANNTHTVDNVGRDNYVLFEFSEVVVVDSAFLGYVVNDSDLTVWIGTTTDPFNNHLTLSDALLGGFFTEVNLTSLSTTRTADLNSGNVSGNVLVIAAWTADTTPEDYFKIKKVTIGQPEAGCYENKAVVSVPGDHDSDLSHYCNPDAPPPTPGIDVEKTTNGPSNSNPTAPDYDNEDAPSGPGVPILTPGSSVTWTYKVTNTGNVPFTVGQVVVTDNNGTPLTTVDDFNPTRDVSSDVGNEGILSPGEVWFYTATGTVQNVTSPGSTSTFDFSGSEPTDGPDGNIRTFTAGSVSVKASAFSRDKSTGTWSTAYLGAYGGGLGVTDSSEGSGSSNMHTVDNVGRDNYVLFEFDQSVIVDSAFLGYVVDDSDLKIWIGTKTNPFNNHQTLSDAFLSSLGFSEVNLTDLTTTRTADFNAGNMSGNILVIAADPGDATPEDRFKIELLKVKQSVPGIYENKATVTVPGDGDFDLSHYKNPSASEQVCVNTTYSFTGSSATDGTDGNTRTFTFTGLTVTVRAYSREKTTPTWASAYVGAYSGGLGVTDSSEGSGANDMHTVDNVGRDNYLVFYFSSPVIIDRAFLGYVVNDSDLNFWVGDSDGTPNTDAELAAMFKGENLTDSASTRWADINNGAVAGNTLVIAGWTADETPEDRFKVQKLDLCKAPAGTLAARDTAATSFWKGTKGVALIKKLNGLTTATNLGNWLAGNFPNLFGSLAGKDNNYISAYMATLGTVDQQILAAGLAAYVTSSDLAGGTWAASTTYGGFNVSASGVGGKTFNVGNKGTALGLMNHKTYSVMELLGRANSLKPFSSSVSSALNTVFSGINSGGGIALSSIGSLVNSEETDRPLITTLQPLYTGQLIVAVDVPAGDQSAEMEAGIADSIDAINAQLGAYGVVLVGVFGDASVEADIHLHVASTTEIGGIEEGVLGLSQAGGELTIVSGWNYYLGADPAGIGADQYDFRTVVMHELGHALGLGHSVDTGSVMFAYLGTVETRRELTAQDLTTIGTHEEHEGGDALMASSFAGTSSGHGPGCPHCQAMARLTESADVIEVGQATDALATSTGSIESSLRGALFTGLGRDVLLRGDGVDMLGNGPGRDALSGRLGEDRGLLGKLHDALFEGDSSLDVRSLLIASVAKDASEYHQAVVVTDSGDADVNQNDESALAIDLGIADVLADGVLDA